ncbi:aldehyde dehydrogenase family protein [Williamsia sp. CHRR-6]|uniref:aldehyde dehydrogenase family protein n=1 Tax=Williamsia sp. CHRR-6 TaxID=2835871 RepID=UPI001BDAC99C|nr:aldehyde dehydrogenase family protein [Williamsia sp. CHRR-6]MBT0566128.1 aldehyde dehydrogenase family protein [Williamsia sp. CHRR-6]
MSTPSTRPAPAAPVRSADEQTLVELLELQRAAFLRDGIPDAHTRIDRINRLASLLLDHAEEITEALDADFGTRPRDLSMATDVAGCMVDLAHQRKHLREWMKTEKVAPAMGAMGFSQRIRHDPLGVVGIMGPWNFPLQLTVVPAGAAFAAGNRVMMRPSSVTHRTTAVLARHAPDYFSLEEFAIVTGAHGSGADFSKLRVDHMFFTGSPEVGASVAVEAGRNLVPVTLELGGKNPVVVDVDADIADAAARVADARMVNSGQVCLCPDYAFVPEAKLQQFVDLVIDRWRTTLPTIVDNDQFTSTVNEKNYTRIVELVEDAVNLGATQRQWIPAGERLPDADKRKIAPTVLTGVKAGMKIEEDEVFGPVLTVYPYRDLAEAVGHINAHSHPLTIYWFGPDNARYEMLQRTTRSGSVNGNDFAINLLSAELPFGGVGTSGMGSYHGKFGFATFSHARAVTYSRMPISFANLMSAPFTAADTRSSDLQLRLWRALTARATRKNR